MLALENLAPVGMYHYLVVSILLFAIGTIGVLTRKNLVVILMCVELMLNAVNLSFLTFSHFVQGLEGQVIVLIIMTIAAAEVGVGLALLVVVFKRYGRIDIGLFEKLKDV